MTETPQELIARLGGFTPGKWERSKSECGTYWSGISAAGWSGLCDVVIRIAGKKVNDAVGEANADLIAAAPDLHRELAAALARETVLRDALGSARKYIKRAPFGLFGAVDAALAPDAKP